MSFLQSNNLLNKLTLNLMMPNFGLHQSEKRLE